MFEFRVRSVRFHSYAASWWNSSALIHPLCTLWDINNAIWEAIFGLQIISESLPIIFGGIVGIDLQQQIGVLHLQIKSCLLSRVGIWRSRRVLSRFASSHFGGFSVFAIIKAVKKVNGIEVDNLKHLRQLVEDSRTENVRFDLDDERVIVLNYDSAKLATSRILKRHRIPSATSNDLIDEQNASDIELSSSK
ncbi:hypothetical protein OROHE_018049 [Orobanche hederae]